VRLAIEHGGIITHFAGDGFLTLFPGDDGLIARQVARAVVGHCVAHGRSETTHGTFEFAVKCGVDVGRVEWGIVRSGRRATWYFQGGPVAGATALEVARTLRNKKALLDPLVTLAEAEARRGRSSAVEEALAEARGIVQELALSLDTAGIDRVAALFAGLEPSGL